MTLSNSNGEFSKTNTFLNAFSQRSLIFKNFIPPTPTRDNSVASHKMTRPSGISDLSPALKTKDNGRYVVWRAKQYDIFEL